MIELLLFSTTQQINTCWVSLTPVPLHTSLVPAWTHRVLFVPGVKDLVIAAINHLGSVLPVIKLACVGLGGCVQSWSRHDHWEAVNAGAHPVDTPTPAFPAEYKHSLKPDFFKYFKSNIVYLHAKQLTVLFFPAFIETLQHIFANYCIN